MGFTLQNIKTIAQHKEKGIKLYNVTLGGEGTYGCKPIFTKEWKQKLSDAKSGDKFIGEKNSFYGKHHSDETKAKLSIARKGKKIGNQNPFYGKHHTDEVKQKIAETARKTFSGKPKSDEQKRKMSLAAKGRKLSPEHIEKNRLKSCIPYKIKIISTGNEFTWLRGSKELSKFLLSNHNIKIGAGALTNAVRKDRPTRHIIIKKFQQDT